MVDGLCNSARCAHPTTGTVTRDGNVEGSYGRIILFVGLHVGHWGNKDAIFVGPQGFLGSRDAVLTLGNHDCLDGRAKSGYINGFLANHRQLDVVADIWVVRFID